MAFRQSFNTPCIVSALLDRDGSIEDFMDIDWQISEKYFSRIAKDMGFLTMCSGNVGD